MTTPMQHNLRILSETVPSMRYDASIPFVEWQKQAKEKLWELLGMDSFKKCDPLLTIEHDITTDEYREVRFTMQSEEGYFFPCVLRIPNNAPSKIPVIVCLQGHSTGFHISLGIIKYPRDEASLKGGDRDFAVQIVKEGYAALAIEQRNFGEAGGAGERGTDCHVSTMTALLNGRTTIGERVWDISRALDAVLENFSIIDENKIYCMGNSGGGTATFYAACIDERIKAAMPSCAVCTFKDSIAAMNHCVCNFVPNMGLHFDMGDLAGLIAPRKLIVVHGKHDPIFPENGVLETYEIIKKMYKAAGAEDNCALVSGEGDHRFYAADSWPVFHNLVD